jgi:hypothetical protein
VQGRHLLAAVREDPQVVQVSRAAGVTLSQRVVGPQREPQRLGEHPALFEQRQCSLVDQAEVEAGLADHAQLLDAAGLEQRHRRLRHVGAQRRQDAQRPVGR